MSYRFVQNKECDYFPCHKTDNLEEFNCLFCYCPLYALGEACGGKYVYTKKGIKSCIECDIVHRKYKGYLHVQENLPKIIAMVQKT